MFLTQNLFLSWKCQDRQIRTRKRKIQFQKRFEPYRNWIINSRKIWKYLNKNSQHHGRRTKKTWPEYKHKFWRWKKKLEDALTKNKVFEKKISRKDVNIFKLESDIQLLMDLRTKEGQINVLRFAPPFVLIPNWKRSVETNTETLHLTEASSQTETQRTHKGQNHRTRSSANQQCHACVKYRDSHTPPSYTDRRNIPDVSTFWLSCAIWKLLHVLLGQ